MFSPFLTDTSRGILFFLLKKFLQPATPDRTFSSSIREKTMAGKQERIAQPSSSSTLVTHGLESRRGSPGRMATPRRPGGHAPSHLPHRKVLSCSRTDTEGASRLAPIEESLAAASQEQQQLRSSRTTAFRMAGHFQVLLMCFFIQILAAVVEGVISPDLIVNTNKGKVRGVTLKSATNK